MPPVSEQRLFDALATLSRAFADGGVPDIAGEPHAAAPSPAIAAMDAEAREVLGEAALAVAFGAFASRGGDGGPVHLLIGAMGLMALLCGEEPDPPAEIMGIAAEDARVEQEVDRAGEAVDAEFGRDATCEAVTGALEARLIGTAIQLAGCTLPEGVQGQAVVRLRAARCLARLAAGLLAMNVAGSNTPGVAPGAPPAAP
ncbi:hypothetical protein [Paracraurococcus lichenis]|uniref:Uncharacterized protein n=1 Tax=Paracraurococcus lichenis TaxID=3064888 RepID=A0ABT9DSJ6_9PROT|nr:hypothetical protein [Paracraurococcus sp. LOR1-02]MDO9706800.1 hypothetical protein [Paracraurococcus sp. LOR1-02]